MDGTAGLTVTSELELSALRIFHHLDGCSGRRDGKLSYMELMPILEQHGIPPELIEVCWNSIDSDNSGFVERAEFLRFCALKSISKVFIHDEASKYAYMYIHMYIEITTGMSKLCSYIVMNFKIMVVNIYYANIYQIR